MAWRLRQQPDNATQLPLKGYRHCPRQDGATHQGSRYPLKRTNSDPISKQHLGSVALAVALIQTVNPVKWVKRWTD